LKYVSPCVLKCAEIAFFSATLVAVAAGQNPPTPGTSTWVFFDSNHHLQYNQDANGNRIMDFSFAGYQGGGVALPTASIQATVNPSGADDTAAIQAAIDAVSALPIDGNGFRGTVQLTPGTFSVTSTLNITASGVILHGAGSGDGGTVINMTGDPFLFLSIAGTGSWKTVGSSAAMTDVYVPSGTTSFNVSNASGFNVGDTVLVRRPVTAAWIHLLGMDTLVRDGKPQTWMSPGSTISTDRTITAINGNLITLDVPLTDSFDSVFLNPPGGSVVKYTFTGRISQVGVEGLNVIAVPKNVDITQPQYQGLTVDALIDGWVRDVVFQDTQNTMQIGSTVKQMTFDSVIVNHTAPHSGDGPADFGFSGTQLFINKCSVVGLNSNVWPAVAQSRFAGPDVLLNFHADDRGFAPHQRWATGLLCDDCTFPNSHTSDKAGVAYSNRGNLGSGQGWDAGWSVAWNVTAKTFTIQQPPGSQNFCIGCIGQILTQARPGTSTPLLPNGIYDSYGTPVTPSSLYLEQLFERKGPQAIIDIGYLDYLKSIDTVAPVTTATLSPSPNANGWNNSDVTVTLNSTDNQFGTGVQQITYSAAGAQNIPSTVSPGASVSFAVTNEGVTTGSFFGSDFAQNVETPNTAVVKLDKTAPSIAGSATPANANGWNNTDVTVAFECADALSGLAPGSPPAPAVLSVEGANQSVDGLCTDQAGNSASTTVSGINIDKTPPTITASPTPAPNANGWNNTDVTVAFQCADVLSGLAAGSPPAPAILSVEGANQSVDGLCTDQAGNSASTTAGGINIDKTPPTMIGSRTPAPNVNGWNNTDVTVAFQCADTLSGLAADSPPQPTILSGEGANQSVTGTCADQAGNSASAAVNAINIDRTAPLLSAVLTPPANANGWNNTDVTITFNAADTFSGVAFVTPPVLVQTEGQNQQFTGNATDLAGNSSSLPVSVSIDKMPPEAFNQFDPVTHDVALFGRDALSGVIPGPIAPASVVQLSKQDDDDDREDHDRDDRTLELRTYDVFDLAGNPLVLIEKVRKSGHSITVRVVSLQYGNGPLVSLPRNRQTFEWEVGRDGALRELIQRFEVGPESHEQELYAHFEAEDNQTVIRDESLRKPTVKPGLVLLEMATQNGNIVVQF
jgi:hypothetical protein